MGREDQALVVPGRVEIDTRQPFRSVKEAVALFGEKVLAGEIYGKQFKEVQTKASGEQNQSQTESPVTIELEETKQNLQRTKEERTFMEDCLQSLKEELELTKREIQQLKTKEFKHEVPLEDPEIEDIKFIENASSKTKVRTQFQDYDNEIEFQKKRSVKFASTPLLTRIIVSKDVVMNDTSSQLKKKLKKNTLIALFGGLFSKKRNQQKQSAKPMLTLFC